MLTDAAKTNNKLLTLQLLQQFPKSILATTKK